MRKITYQNSVNGLAMSFSSTDALTHLDALDGSSCGSRRITYTPFGMDGQKLISANLDARTITVSVSFTDIRDGKYSREAALLKWRELLRVFVPGNTGVLTWTDGTNSRQIVCETVETPNYTQRLPWLFSAELTLIADSPYWYDTAVNTLEIDGTYSSFTLNNDCGLPVPFQVTVTQRGAQPFIFSKTLNKGIVFARGIGSADGCVVDTESCTVTLFDGSLANHLLAPASDFFRLVPGDNELDLLPGVGSSAGTGVLTWRKAYMGVD